jgi:hypothetical protein
MVALSSVICRQLDILKHVQFIHLSLYWIFFFFRDKGGGVGGGGLLPLKIHGWFSTQHQAEWISKNYVHIKNQNHFPCWIPGLPPCEMFGFRPSFNPIRRTAAPLFSSSLGFPRNSKIFKGVWHKIFEFIFLRISLPLGAISNFYENSRRYLQLCVYRRCRVHRR